MSGEEAGSISIVIAIFSFVIGLVIALLIGYITSRYAQKKGREKGVWFLLGFLFGLIPLIILAFLPSKAPANNIQVNYYQEQVIVNDGARGNNADVTRTAQNQEQPAFGRDQSVVSPAPNLPPTKLVNPAEPPVGWLVIRSGAQANKEFALPKSETKIGRSSTCQISLDNDTLSREHAKIIYRGSGTFEILDLGSRNGTKVNGQPIQKQMLYDNDVVQTGEVKFVFKSVK